MRNEHNIKPCIPHFCGLSAGSSAPITLGREESTREDVACRAYQLYRGKAKVVWNIFQWYTKSKRLTIAAIMGQLSTLRGKQDPPLGKRWRHFTVRAIRRRPDNTGQAYCNRTRTEHDQSAVNEADAIEKE